MTRILGPRTTTLVAALLTLALLAGGLVYATRAAGRGDPAQATALRQLDAARLTALVEADVETLRTIHAADFTLVPPPGTPLNRTEYLEAISVGALDFSSFEPISDTQVRFYGQAAVLTYESRIEVEAAGLGSLTHDAWHTLVYERRQGSWQLVREQTTAVGGFPPPG